MITYIHMTSTTWGFAIDSLGRLLHTIDGGRHWNVTSNDTTASNPLAVSFPDGAFRCVPCGSLALPGWVTASSGGAPELLFTPNGGLDWHSANLPPVAPGSITDVDFVDPQDGWLLTAPQGGSAGSEEVEIYRTTDGGETWSKVAASPPEDPHGQLPFGGVKSGIEFVSPTRGFLAASNLRANGQVGLYVTDDGGATWKQVGIPVPAGLSHDYTGSTVPIFVTTQRGLFETKYWDEAQQTQYDLFATDDAGATWKAVKSVSVNAGGMTCAGALHCWWVVNATLYATSDGGSAWHLVLTAPWLATAAELDFVDSAHGWAVSGTYGNIRLRITDNGGARWTALSPAIGGA